ncbi:hypothetical protein [Flavobacterium sp.]|uniref:hypothetical protein n=1 Tax=Flavobacterium sp. TaxID=239 RepID=UPI00286D5C9D|nr:hypothetical protein [Flavobacterium sp.]
MKTTLERIEEIKTNGYPLDFANVFEHAFQNYKKIALYAGLMLLVFSILFVILAAIGVFLTVDMDSIGKNMKPEMFEPQNFSISFLIKYILGIIVFTALLSPFTAGFLKMADCAEKGEEFNVSTIFTYYKAPYFKDIVLATLLITIITSGSSILLDYYGYKFVGLLITVPVSFVTFMTIPLIVFGKLNAFDAIKSSSILVLKQPLVLVALLIVGIIASMVGFIGCCIGVIFTIPFMYSMHYCIYNAIIGIEPENESVIEA